MILRLALCACAFVALAACRGASDAAVDTSAGVAPLADGRTTPPAQPWLTEERRAEEDSVFHAAAVAAWRFANRNHVAATGLIRPFDSYAIATMWDIASGLGATFSAMELGLLDTAEYDGRMRRALATLERLTLFEDVGFNKEYQVETGQVIGIERQPASKGFGTSAIDTGRLLLWLRIIADRHPQHRASAERVAARIDRAAYVDDGYLVGRQLSRRTGRARTYQEGRLGYEQYAAKGFEAWGTRAERALDITENLRPTEVLGVMVPADDRGGDRLTSEPFVLMGLEAGFTAAERASAEAVLRVQEARFRQTDTLTLVSEDAINIPPDYFFYYTILSRHGPWTIDVQRPNARVRGPRWVSTKAAFAWHALMPGDYTRRVMDTVRTRAKVSDVWGAGVFDNGKPTANPNINTAAVVLEAALFRKRGGPLLGGRAPATNATAGATGSRPHAAGDSVTTAGAPRSE